MRKVRLPKDMTPSPRPWAWGIVPSGKHAVAVVKGNNGKVVCICHPANARDICGGVNPIEDIYAYGTGV